MARYVLLEFEDGDEHDADDFVESMTEYNLGFMIKNGHSCTWREIQPNLAGVYDSITAIEGKTTKGH